MSNARAAYYLLLMALLMPALPGGQPPSASDMAMTTAGASDTFCSRQAELCNATNYLLRKIEAKAKYPIYVLTSWPSATVVRPLENQA